MTQSNSPAEARRSVRIGALVLCAAAALAFAPASLAQDQATVPVAPATTPPATTAPTTMPPAKTAPAPPPTASTPTAPEAPTTPAAAPTTPPVAAQDCMACHGMTKDAAPMIGPNLWGVVGRKAGSTEYAYSPAMKTYGQTWTPANLQAFIQAPTTVVPGTLMAYPGVADPAAAKAVVDYLDTLHD